MEIVIGEPTNQDSLGGAPQFVVCVTAFDLKGKQLWQYGKPGQYHIASSDIPLQVYDLDGDGASEVVVAMNNTTLTVLDGKTGTVKRTIKLPATNSNDCITFANLTGKEWPQDIILKDRYTTEWAISSDGTLLWTHKGTTGHYPLAYDWDGDKKDEVMAGYDFLESDGTVKWSVKNLTMHADSIATADLDANPANGNEIVICGNHGSAFDSSTGQVLWEDTHTVEAQQIGVGEYRPDSPGLEVVMLDRIGPRNSTGVDANVLLDAKDTLLWKETRAKGAGWMTVTENLNNWDGTGRDLIFSYRRGSGGVSLYDGYNKQVANFAYPGSEEQNFATHADLCGDSKEEVIVYDQQTLWIYANDGCDLDAPPAKPSLPQQFHLYNWSIYSGWINPDLKFYTPGSKQ
jgi:hypothetical protein